MKLIMKQKYQKKDISLVKGQQIIDELKLV